MRQCRAHTRRSAKNSWKNAGRPRHEPCTVLVDEPGRVDGRTTVGQRDLAAAVDEKVERQRVSAENAKKHAPIKRERIIFTALAIALPIFVVVVAVNVFGMSPASLFETPPSPAVARIEAQRMLDTLVTDIEVFQKNYQTLPESLVEIGRPEKGSWTYTVAGAAYRVQGTLYGQTVNFTGTSTPDTAKDRELRER